MANKDSLRRKSAAADAYGRIKQGRAGHSDAALADTVGKKTRLSKRPKVAAGGNKPRTPGLR